MTCGTSGCSCSYCEKCGERYEYCICELIEDTKRWLAQSDYTYEDRAHSGEYLIKRWLNTTNA